MTALTIPPRLRWLEMRAFPSLEWEVRRRASAILCLSGKRSQARADEGHQLTLTERHHRECLTEEMTFQEMAVGLGWTYRQVVSAGTHQTAAHAALPFCCQRNRDGMSDT